MSTMDAIAAFFNNQSVGAFLGAFAAFFLVVINDWRRERRKIVTLRAEIEVNMENARSKLETVRRNRKAMREDLKVAPAPILRFNTTFTRQIASEVLHHPTIDQRIAVEALTYTMEAIDELLAETLALSQKFMRPMGQADRQSTTEHLLSNFADSVSNLRRLIEQCQSYIDGDFRRIIAKQYDPRDYEEA